MAPRTLAAAVTAVAALAVTLVTASPAPAQAANEYNRLIYNVKTGKCLDVPWEGPPTQASTLQQWDCIPGTQDNQRFDLVYVTGDLFVIRSSKNPSLCLDLPGTEPVGNSAVGFYPCQYSTDDNQLWLWGQPPGGVTERTLVNRKSQDTGFPHCLDVGGYGNKANGVPVGLYRCAMFDRNDDHLWYTKNG
ncbi:RICIN domain-containing protein [Streptomyces sp. NPDC056544]|uniref:RICIN domain-containing protein n=1 Tax=unclassified Streptomyces TaxID=2593676 RepID=UPI0036754176